MAHWDCSRHCSNRTCFVFPAIYDWIKRSVGCGGDFFFGLVAVFSQNLRAVNWHTIIWGFSLQMILAVLVLKVEFVYTIISAVGGVVKKFIGFSDAGAQFVFGNLADARPPAFGGTWSKLFESNYMFQFAFVALPPFYSSLLSLLCFITLEFCRSASGYWQGSWST